MITGDDLHHTRSNRVKKAIDIIEVYYENEIYILAK